MNLLKTKTPSRHREPVDFVEGVDVVRVSEGGHDPDWDVFLARQPAGHHVQSSLWAEVKAINGWSTQRITVAERGQIVGGAQLLIRNVKFLGAVGYVPKGPVLDPVSERHAGKILDKVCEIAKSKRLKVLFVQPSTFETFTSQLVSHGFAACPVETAPTATFLLDLTCEPDAILARMPKGMRNQIRRGQKRGITVREGGQDDLPIFHQLLSATSQRRGFSIFDLEYFQGMWNILAPAGCIKLFLSDLNGEPVSAQICVSFGDTLIAKQIGWSGQHSRLHPNEALDWFTIQWAKDHGFRYYDLEGLERSAAEALVSGKPLPEKFANTPTAYKLRLGGDVNLYPGASCYFPNPVLRKLYNRIGFQVANGSIFQKAVGRFRTG